MDETSFQHFSSCKSNCREAKRPIPCPWQYVNRHLAVTSVWINHDVSIFFCVFFRKVFFPFCFALLCRNNPKALHFADNNASRRPTTFFTGYSDWSWNKCACSIELKFLKLHCEELSQYGQKWCGERIWLPL